MVPNPLIESIWLTEIISIQLQGYSAAGTFLGLIVFTVISFYDAETDCSM